LNAVVNAIKPPRLTAFSIKADQG